MFYRCADGVTLVRVDAVNGISRQRHASHWSNEESMEVVVYKWHIHLNGSLVLVTETDAMELASLLEKRMGLV